MMQWLIQTAALNLARWALAWLLCRLQRRFNPCGRGRHTDWTPCRCAECHWRGPVRWTVHTYEGYADEDTDETEAVDECPACGSTALLTIEDCP